MSWDQNLYFWLRSHWQIVFVFFTWLQKELWCEEQWFHFVKRVLYACNTMWWMTSRSCAVEFLQHNHYRNAINTQKPLINFLSEYQVIVFLKKIKHYSQEVWERLGSETVGLQYIYISTCFYKDFHFTTRCHFKVFLTPLSHKSVWWTERRLNRSSSTHHSQTSCCVTERMRASLFSVLVCLFQHFALWLRRQPQAAFRSTWYYRCWR